MRFRTTGALLCMALILLSVLPDVAHAAGLAITSDDGRIQLQLPEGWHQEQPDKPSWSKPPAKIAT